MISKSKRVEKFEKLAEKRVNDVIKKLQLIGNLSNRSNYEYTDEHVKQMFSVIKGELREAESKFVNAQSSTSNNFKFKN